MDQFLAASAAAATATKKEEHDDTDDRRCSRPADRRRGATPGPDDDWAHEMTADWVAEMGERGVPEHNALALLNKLMDDISEFRDRTGANPN
jgi:hypothetical protein